MLGQVSLQNQAEAKEAPMNQIIFGVILALAAIGLGSLLEKLVDWREQAETRRR